MATITLNNTNPVILQNPPVGSTLLFTDPSGNVNLLKSNGATFSMATLDDLNSVVGVTGPQGVAGVTGPQGVAGVTGPQGVAGVTGPQGSGTVVPPTAKLYSPDAEGMLSDVFYLLANEPVGATDSIWSGWVGSRVADVDDFGVDPLAVLNKGIYEINDFQDEFGTFVRNIGYSGVLDFGAFEGPTATPNYTGTNYYFQSSFTDGSYLTFSNFTEVNLSGDIEVSYFFDGTDNSSIETQVWFQNIPSRNIAISLNVIIDNTGASPSGTYSLQLLGNAN